MITIFTSGHLQPPSVGICLKDAHLEVQWVVLWWDLAMDDNCRPDLDCSFILMLVVIWNWWIGFHTDGKDGEIMQQKNCIFQ